MDFFVVALFFAGTACSKARHGFVLFYFKISWETFIIAKSWYTNTKEILSHFIEFVSLKLNL